METALIVIGSLLLTAAVVLAFRPSRWSAPTAFVGMIMFYLAGWLLTVDVWTLVFWGAATAIVVGIDYLLPREVVDSSRGVGYIVGATLAGTLVGLLVSDHGLIIGAVVGAFLGALAYVRTPAGRDIAFPSKKFVNYLAAKGLPAVVTMCIIGIVVGLLAYEYAILQNLGI